MFVPLVHRPGEAQVDFGEALVRLGGKLRVVKFFLMALPYSDAFFVMAFERECTETFGEGHVQAFQFFGGVPRRISYDNTRIAVAQILGTGRARKLTTGFLQLQSHYLFEHHFCRVRRANEKGVVEGGVKFARLNFFVPVPQVRDLAELNTYLLQCGREDLARRLRGHTGTKAELLAHDREAFLPLPAVPFVACRNASTTASSLSLVRFDDNDYSVPVRWAHHPVVVHGDYREVVRSAGAGRGAAPGRSWGGARHRWGPHFSGLLGGQPGGAGSCPVLCKNSNASVRLGFETHLTCSGQ